MQSSQLSPSMEAQAASNTITWRNSERRPLRSLLLVAIVLAIIVIVRSSLDAWRANSLREAYLPELEMQAKANPNDGRLQIVLGVRLVQAGEHAAAVEHFQQAVSTGIAGSDVWSAWVASYMAAQEPAQAEETLQLGLKNPTVAADLRRVLTRLQSLPPQSSHQQRAEVISPQGVAPLLENYAGAEFFDFYSQWKGKRNPAQSGFATREAWMKADPKNLEYQRLWGEALLQNRRYVDAENILRQALEQDSKSLALRLAHADAQRMLGEKGKAALEYIAILKEKKDWLPALLGLGQVTLDKRLLTMGVDVFERSVKQDPNNVEAWIGLARAHYNLRLNMGRALQAYEKAVELAPNNTSFYNSYSTTLRANFKFPEAEAVIRRRLADSPTDAQAHYLLALILLDHKPSPERRSEALEALQSSRKFGPDVTATDTRYAQLLLEDDKVQEAIAVLENVIRYDLFSLTAYQALARAYRKVGLKQEAAQVQESATELAKYLRRTGFLVDLIQRQPNNLKAHKELAELYERGHEPEAAARQREMVAILEKYPERATQGIRNFNEATSMGKAVLPSVNRK